MKYEKLVLAQCRFQIDDVSGFSTLVERRSAISVSQRVEVVLVPSGRRFTLAVEVARLRGFWNESTAEKVPQPKEDQLLLFDSREVLSVGPRYRSCPAFEEFFGKVVQPPRPKRRRDHAGGFGQLNFEEGEATGGNVTGVHQFDFDAVDRNLGWAEPDQEGPHGGPSEDGVIHGTAIVLELLNWLQATLDKGFGVAMPGSERNIFIRLHALRYYLDRSTMGALTLEQLRHQLGVSRETLRFLLDDLEQRYGLKSPLRKSEQARKALQDAPRPLFHPA